jgi:hypothetical protein
VGRQRRVMFTKGSKREDSSTSHKHTHISRHKEISHGAQGG